MNLILLDAAGPRVTLAANDPRLEHVRGVLRMTVGNVFDVGLVNGPRGKARIEALDEAGLHLEVTWGERPALPPPIWLLVGLPRPATARKILQEATTLGVREVAFFDAEKGDPAYGRSSLWVNEAWRASCRLGAEQAFDTYVPEVRRHGSLAEALEGFPGPQGVALDVYEGTIRLGEWARQSTGAAPRGLAIGPERGWTAAERRRLRERGLALAHVGTRVLRVETAVIVGLALLHEHYGALGGGSATTGR